MLNIVNNRLLLKFPFVNPQNEEAYNIVHCNLDFNAIPVSQALRDLLKHMLDISQESRYTADEVINHPWMQSRYEEVMTDVDCNPVSTSYLERDPSSTSEKTCRIE